MRTPLRSLILAAALAGVPACNTSHVEQTDAGIVIPDSAALPDTFVPDAWVPPTPVGTACTSDTDCQGGTSCAEDPDFFPGGYCTQNCDEADPATCPEGSECRGVGGGQALCFASCDPGVTDSRQCARVGHGCATNPMFSAVCIAGCFDASDCAAGQMCDVEGGALGSGACYDPTAVPGEACLDDATCPMGGFCQTEAGTGWPAGACLSSPCDATGNTGCAGDAQCVTSTSPFGSTDYCVDGCTTSADCRAGYECRPSTSHADRLGCFPGCTSDAVCSEGRVCNDGLGTCDDPFDPSALGQTCSGRDPSTCLGGTCLTEGSTGYPRAYCAYSGCSDTDPCPGTGVCAPTASGVGLCLDGCASDSDCRAEYACRPSNASMPTSPLACVPACAADTDCGNAMRGFVCNPGTGTCGQPFTAASLGEPCAAADQCDGGVCFTEAARGWPAGTCTYPGCRLSGTGPTAICPPGAACIDDGVGSPDLGSCVDACVVATSSCRPGYACVASGGSTTDGACLPACTAGSCAGGRTCSATTGLCE